MVYFNRTSFGSVTIDGQKYGDILVIEGEIENRERDNLERIFGTSHLIAPFEVSKLLSGKPDVIIIGKGQSGALQVQEEVKKKLAKGSRELIILETPQAIRKYNELAKQGRKINALIHVTC